MWQCLVLLYPVAPFAVAYAFRTRRDLVRAWAAYGLAVLPALVLALKPASHQIRYVFLGVLAILAILGLYGWWNRPRPSSDGSRP